MSTQEYYDLVILGSGSTAFAAALHAADLGKTAVMTEFRTVGGTCANRGCLPSKNLIEAARLVYDAAHPRYPGLTPVHMPFSWAELVAQRDEILHEYRAHKYESLLDASDQMQVVAGQVCLVSDHEVEVQSAGGVCRLVGEQILIATGSAPLIPGLPGLANVPYLTSDLLSSSDDPWGTALREQLRSLLILGGGSIALELGQMFARFGTQVTLITRGSTILSGYEPEIAEALTAILQEEGLRIVTGAQVCGVRHEGEGVALSIQRHGSQQTLSAEKLLVATGRRPNTQEIGLEQAGVKLNQEGAVRVDCMPRTNVTDPQVAVVGMTEEEAVAVGIACNCNTIPLSVVPRARAIRDTRGVIKMVLDGPTRRVVGVSMLEVNAGEVIGEAAMALRFGATTDDFIDLIHVYPTMSEALQIVAISFTKDVNRLSCCAS